VLSAQSGAVQSSFFRGYFYILLFLSRTPFLLGIAVFPKANGNILPGSRNIIFRLVKASFDTRYGSPMSLYASRLRNTRIWTHLFFALK